MISTLRAGAGCLALLLALTGCTTTTSTKGNPVISVSTAATTGTTGTSGASASARSGTGTASTKPGSTTAGRTPPVSGPPTSLGALPTVPGSSPSHTPPLTPVSKLACPKHDAMTKAFGVPMTGDPVDGDDDPNRLYCGYQTASGTPYVLSVTTSEDGHAGYVTQADDVRTVAKGKGTVEPVLGFGDESLVEVDRDGSATYAGKLLVRFGTRTVLVFTTVPTSTLQHLSLAATLFY